MLPVFAHVISAVVLLRVINLGMPDMKAIILLLLLLTIPTESQAADVLRSHRVWVYQHTRWEKAPPEVESRISTASATVLYFRDDGKFGMVDCFLIKGRRSLGISNGDGLNIYVGEWSEKDGVINVSYRLVERTVRMIGETLPSPVQTAIVSYKDKRNRSARISPAARLVFNGKEYAPTFTLDEKSVQSIIGNQM